MKNLKLGLMLIIGLVLGPNLHDLRWYLFFFRLVSLLLLICPGKGFGLLRNDLLMSDIIYTLRQYCIDKFVFL